MDIRERELSAFFENLDTEEFFRLLREARLSDAWAWLSDLAEEALADHGFPTFLSWKTLGRGAGRRSDCFLTHISLRRRPRPQSSSSICFNMMRSGFAPLPGSC